MKKTLLIALIAAALAPSAAQAQSYVGVNAGSGKQTLSFDATVGIPENTIPLSSSDTGTAIKVYGGYDFTKHVGIEGGYTDLGKASPVGYGLETHPRSMYIAATGTLPLAQHFALTGKIGAASTRLTVNSDGESFNETKSSLLLGIGASYAITPAILAVVEFESYGDIFKDDGVTVKAKLISAGVRFKF